MKVVYSDKHSSLLDYGIYNEGKKVLLYQPQQVRKFANLNSQQGIGGIGLIRFKNKISLEKEEKNTTTTTTTNSYNCGYSYK